MHDEAFSTGGITEKSYGWLLGSCHPWIWACVLSAFWVRLVILYSLADWSGTLLVVFLSPVTKCPRKVAQKQEGLFRLTILWSRIMAGKVWWGERHQVLWAGTWGSCSQVTADRKQRGMEAFAQPVGFPLFLFLFKVSSSQTWANHRPCQLLTQGEPCLERPSQLF